MNIVIIRKRGRISGWPVLKPHPEHRTGAFIDDNDCRGGVTSPGDKGTGRESGWGRLAYILSLRIALFSGGKHSSAQSQYSHSPEVVLKLALRIAFLCGGGETKHLPSGENANDSSDWCTLGRGLIKPYVLDDWRKPGVTPCKRRTFWDQQSPAGLLPFPGKMFTIGLLGKVNLPENHIDLIFLAFR